MRNVRKELRIRRRLIRRLIKAQRDAMILRLFPAMASIQLAMLAADGAAANRTPNPD